MSKRSLLPTALLTAMVMGGCGQPTAQNGELPPGNFQEVTVNGKRCVLYERFVGWNNGVAGLTCDWKGEGDE